MPRNGAGVASPIPGFNTVAASTTILSALHNSGINDIFTILNSAWPVSLGGTGGSNSITSWDAITAKGTDIASASTIVLTTATGPRIDITGVTTITAVTLANGSSRIARATGAFQFTASATLLVNGSAAVNYTTTSGDLLFFEAEGGITSVYVIGSAAGAASTVSPLNLPVASNMSIGATVAGSALTISLLGRLGTTPSASSPVVLPFRNQTSATGTVLPLTVTAATTLVVSSGSTLGTSGGSTPFRLWVVAFSDSGVVRIGVINCVNFGSGTIYPLGVVPIASSTAEGGAGAADSAQVFYTGTAVTSKAYQVLGYLEWGSGLATAGTWASAPTIIQTFDPVTTRLPGTLAQATARSETGAVATGTTLIPYDDTIPQITEGNEYMTQAITPTSVANFLRITCGGYYGTSVASNVMVSCLFQDANTDALAVGMNYALTAGGPYYVGFQHQMVAATISSTTFRNRAGGVSAGTLTFNGASAARKFGGTLASFLQVEEIVT